MNSTALPANITTAQAEYLRSHRDHGRAPAGSAIRTGTILFRRGLLTANDENRIVISDAGRRALAQRNI